MFSTGEFHPESGVGCFRSKSFPLESNYYKAASPQFRVLSSLRTARCVHYGKADEVARNGALQEALRPEVFLDAPLHKLPQAPLVFKSLRLGYFRPPLYARASGSRTSIPA